MQSAMCVLQNMLAPANQVLWLVPKLCVPD